MIPLLDLKAQYSQIKDQINAAIRDVLESQYFILGPTVSDFEKNIVAYTQSKYAIGVASGSDALLLSLMAIDLRPGDEVITTPYTFFSTASCISRLGAKPVFVDIDPKTYNIDPNLIEAKITLRTKAIIPVDLYGQAADMDPIMACAKKHQLTVIEDAAQALSATYKGKKCSTLGDLGAISFFPSKNLGGYGDGGMVITDNEELAEKIKILRVHGAKPKYYHDYIGCASRLDALQAAVLNVKLKYLDQWSQGRQKNAKEYDALFSSKDVQTPFIDEHCQHVYNQYVIRVSKRDPLRDFLKEKEISTEIYYPRPLHLQKCFADLGYKEGDFPESEKAAQETLALPIYPELSQQNQRMIVDTISQFYN